MTGRKFGHIINALVAHSARLKSRSASPSMASISRRDLLNGAALTIAAGLTPAAQIAAQPSRYPPALTGMRGQHPGSFETAHEFVQDRSRFAFDEVPVGEDYDLVVVG